MVSSRFFVCSDLMEMMLMIWYPDYCLGRKKTGSAGGQGGEEKEAEKDEQQQEVNWDGVEYLCDRLVELRFDGGRCLNVYGWGVVPEYGDEDYG
jgi:hypothetical protein